MKLRLKPILSAIAGALVAALGFIGSLSICFCTFPLLATILALLGISTLFLADYHVLFLVAGLVLVGLSIFLLLRPKKRCTCKPKRKKR